ncbi:hypothetical protein NNC19_15735 [Clostridium sp. SHJSY1]|uniref:hypothetical protein n=1 Tax=Clostridium sp. SHJSY1 TaxID=2942483 RepID=UPI0028759E62|nr:hypothetical protein [Clostridium sp. SHJSY1]MDS0527142.1 hypothetical protein [Clostridium sp. SHJSY1]
MIPEFADRIDRYIESNNSYEGQQRVFLDGDYYNLKIYSLPIEFLWFNEQNGRFIAEKAMKEKELGFKIDTMNREHNKYICELLLQGKANCKELENDLKKCGQKSPGYISNDGFVIDANRRLALFMTLHTLTGDNKYKYMRVYRIDKDLSPKKLYKIQVQLQIAKDYKLDYEPINRLLNLKKGRELYGLTNKELADVHNRTENEIKTDFEVLTLIDQFLEYIGEKNDYTKVFELHDHFVEFNKELKLLKNKKGNSAMQNDDEAMDIINRILKLNTDKYGKSIPRDYIRNISDGFIDSHIKKNILDNIIYNKNASNDQIYSEITLAYELIKNKRAMNTPIELAKKAKNVLMQIDRSSDLVKGIDFRNIMKDVQELVNSYL